MKLMNVGVVRDLENIAELISVQPIMCQIIIYADETIENQYLHLIYKIKNEKRNYFED